MTRTIKQKEDYGYSSPDMRNNQINTTHIVSPFTNSFNMNTWKRLEDPRNKIHMPATNCFYLPHHSVIKDASSTTKLRAVFDDSAKSASGVSFNDRLMAGPQLQKDLFELLIRFRFHQVALIADIAKMYRQDQFDDKDNNFYWVL